MRPSVSRLWRRVAAVAIAILAQPGVGRAQNCDPPPAASLEGIPFEELQGSRRESQFVTPSPNGETPLIGFIDSPTATCYQPNAAVDVCWVNWYYLSVNASPNYMICMRATINEFGPVANYQGFFQTSMYAPYNMHGQGFRVSCGALGASGNPNLGKAYAYTIRAYDSAGLSSANYGTVWCPAFIP